MAHGESDPNGPTRQLLLGCASVKSNVLPRGEEIGSSAVGRSTLSIDPCFCRPIPESKRASTIQLQDLRTLSCPRTLSFFLSLARKESLLSFAVSCPFVANCSLKKMKFFPSASTSSLLTATSAVILASSKLAAEAEISQSLQNVLKNTHGSEAYHYPTDFTRGIMPVSVQMQPSRSGGDRKLSAGELGAFS